MIRVKDFPANLLKEEKNIFYSFFSFPDFFCVDWFSHHQPSKLMHVISELQHRKWIMSCQDKQGFYSWSDIFPRQSIMQVIRPDELSAFYRNAAKILLDHNPNDEKIILTVAHLYILSGVGEQDIEFILRAASIEEQRYNVSSAIQLYDSILEFTGEFIGNKKNVILKDTLHSFIKAIERRVSLSLFHPSLKKIDQFLLIALESARHLNDLKSQALIEILKGQHHWMYFQYEQAVYHFNRGWDIIQQLDDEELYKQGLKVQGLVLALQGQLRKALTIYEQSLGELEYVDNNDFFLLAALNMALCYSEVGMPQRGLGITEKVRNYCQKTNNLPLMSFALVTAGMILLEIGQRQRSKTFLEKALDLAKKENIPMVEVLAGISLSDVECQTGNFKLAGEHFKVIWKIRKSSWYHILNYFPIFETPFILYEKGVSPIELKPFFDFLQQIKKTDLNPLMYGIIQRLHLGLPDNNVSPADKIKILTKLEKTIMRMGATFELAKIRIELARLFSQTTDNRKAGQYAKKAWSFFQPIAPESFPQDVKRLIQKNKEERNIQLFNSIVEMGEALNRKTGLEQLLTDVITSISRLMGSERAALFIRKKDSSSLKMVASRNLLMEELENDISRNIWAAVNKVADANDWKIVQCEISGDDLSGHRRAIIAPLGLDEKIFGVLYQDSLFFSFDVHQDNLKLLSTFTTQIAVSIDRAQAYDEIAKLNKRLIQENLYYREEIKEMRPFGEIIGASESVRALKQMISKVAPTHSTVLIHGETGVGKELVARAIHDSSPRKEGPFIKVNCAALPETLIDSELFGHEKGSFTGATKTKEGRFELANQGTIFLDEISELPLATQSRLLRILQEKEFQRVGGTKTLRSDFRLIAATNKDLNREVAEGKFRADLFFRLNVFPIFVPPLRERIEDIPQLAMHFLNLYCSVSNRQYSGIPETEMQKLQSYEWPGNIRELSNMIERSVILGEPTIRFPQLEEGNLKTARRTRDMKLTHVERDHILEALKSTGGKLSGTDGAAKLLGLNRTTLIYRMKKLGIENRRHPFVVDETAL